MTKTEDTLRDAGAAIAGTPTTPVVHLNGTSGRDLLEQQRAVSRAIAALREALANASPNGRDYYVVSQEALGRALSEHRAELTLLNAMEERHTAISMAILDQQRR